MSSKFRKIQPKPKKHKVPKPKKKKQVVFLPVRSIYRDVCESAWNDYKLGQQLGQGRSGSVFELCDEMKQCPYVLKVEESGRFNTPNFTDEVEYQHRARAVAPKIFDAWVCQTNDGSRMAGFIVMERMDGTLNDFLISNPITMEFGKKLMKTLRSHVYRLHKMGIVHGDLHTENIYFKGKKWFIGDFGEAGGWHPSADEQSLERLKLKLEDAFFEGLVIKK